MYQQLSEIEFAVLNSLADGEEPLSLMLQELHEGTHPWEGAVVVASLAELMDRQLARCVRHPTGMAFTNPSRETLQAYLAHPQQAQGEYWFELTDNGQAVWETWRRTRPA